MGMISVFVGAMVGGCFGVVVTCLAVAAKRADERDGVYEAEDKHVSDTALPKAGGKIIRFTDPKGGARRSSLKRTGTSQLNHCLL